MPIDPTDPELDYRAKNYQDLKSVKSKQIACATCGANLSTRIEKPRSMFVHPLMSTLQCKKCSDFYGDGDFSMDEDGEDKYCRMCGNGGELYLCGNKPCPYGFCHKCIDRYIGKNSSEVEADDWKCLGCNCKPLWEVRAVCAVIVLEKSRKRIKHRKISTTRRQEQDSDDASSRIEDSNEDFKSTLSANRRAMRSIRRSKTENKIFQKLDKVCDSSDDSHDRLSLKYKPIVEKNHSNTENRTMAIESSKESNGLTKRLTSSEDGTTDADKARVSSEKSANSRSENTVGKPESEYTKKQMDQNQSSKNCIKLQKKTTIVSQKQARVSESVEGSKKLSSNSDSESSHESANDFVKSKKKKKLITQKENSNEKDSIIGMKKSNNTESSTPKNEPKHLNTRFAKLMRYRKMHSQSSVESKSRNRENDNSIKKSITITKNVRRTARSNRDTSESNDEINGSYKPAPLSKKHAPQETERHSDPGNEVNKSRKISSKKVPRSSSCESSSDSKSTNLKNGNNSIKKLSTNTIREKTAESKHDTSESDDEMNGSRKGASSIKKNTIHSSRENKRYNTESENEEDEDKDDEHSKKKISTSVIDRKSKQGMRTKNLSTKPLTPTTQTSSSPLDYDHGYLDNKKAAIKQSYATKFASSKDCVIEDQATEIKNHLSSLLSDVEMFGKSLCAGAKGIAAKHLTKNDTSVSAVSKTVLKCSLLMIRCKKGLDNIERDFNKSYDNWCKSTKVKSIFSDLEIMESQYTNDNVDSTNGKETSVDMSKKDKKDKIPQNRAASGEHNSAERSDASDKDDNENCKIDDQPTPDVRSPTESETENTPKKSKDKSLETEKEDSDDSKSSEKKINETTRDSEKRESDAESRNSEHNAMSDCDTREIFSEDESGKETDRTAAPAAKKICIQSSPSNVSEKRSIESDSKEADEDDPEHSKEGREKSMECDDMIENETNVGDEEEKMIDNTSEKSIGEESGDEDGVNDAKELDASSEDLFHDAIASDDENTSNLNENTSNLNEKSKELSNSNLSLSNRSKNTEKSSPSNKEVGNSSPNEMQIENDDETLDLPEKSPTNERGQSPKSKNDSKLKNSGHESSTNANESEGDLSDCDTAIIFTQMPTDLPITESTPKKISKSKENAEDINGTADSCMSESIEIPLQKDLCFNANHDAATPSKKKSDSPKAIDKHSGGKDNSNSNENIEDVSGCVETLKEGQENEIASEKDSAALLSNDEENDPAESVDAIEDNEKDDSEKEERTAVEDDSEEAFKRKILDSDSESSDDSTTIKSNNFVLKVNSDSEEYAKESILADSGIAMRTTDTSNISKKLQNAKIDTEKCKTKSSDSPRPIDTDISELNDLAKHRLLSSSSNSSSSEVDDISLTFPENVDSVDAQSTSSKENDKTSQSSINGNGSTSSKGKSRKFNVENNLYYKTDKKLQMTSEVRVRRLNENVLDQFKKFLGRSKERQEWLEFKSLVDLNNLKKRKRGTKENNQSESSSESTSSKSHVKKKRSRQVQEKEETLLDHLENMKNGENFINPSGDEETEENNDVMKKNLLGNNAEDELLTKANEFAKDLLIQSSDSENEMETVIEYAEEVVGQEGDSKPETENEEENENEKDNGNEEAVDSEFSNPENESTKGNNDNEETKNDEESADVIENEDSDSDRTRERKKMKEGLAKRNWRLTDSDSSSEEKKWNKSQEKKSDGKSTPEKEENDEKVKKKEEEGSKRKKKGKRRVLGSDSDSVKLTDLSDSSNDDDDDDDDKKNSSTGSENSSELFENLRKKRRRKRNAGQKSDSDSESEEDNKRSKQKRKRIKKMASDSDTDDSGLNNSQGKLHRKNIRKVLKDKQVADVTKIAGKEEEERLRRIADRQKLYNEMYELKLASEAKVDKLVLDFDEETKKELVSVHEDLVKRLKPHQAQGIKFMWDACFESLERTKSTKGSGCIVAHCMGLGKTFQVVTLAHTLLTHPETGIKTIMVICPLSTVLNWVNEFKKWLGDINNDEDVEVFEMTKMKKNFERKYQLEKWHRAGGVMVLGYEMFRLLSNQTGKKMRKSLHESILKCLVDPGPDLIVCDEGHLLKNEDTALSKAMRRVKTLRRVVLTGTPLQNNLVEYHCMVQFVKPNLLGTKKEFLNRFVNPITNGQFDDSTEYDVKLMKKRAHVLHKMLEGSVQRFDYSVLTPFLPPKQEYVITVRLADIQIKLYQHYLDHLARKKVGAGTSLFADFQALQRIWTHPIVLRMNAEKMEKLNEKRRMDESDDSEGSLKDFLDDGSDEKSTTTEDDSDVHSAHSSSEEKTVKPRRGTRANPIDPDTIEIEEEEQPQSGEWWNQFVEPEHFEDLRISSKLVLLFAILKECEQIGDKVLVFSQSLYALSLIEEFLNKIDDETQRGTASELIDGHTGSWSLGLDYFRLDGQTPPENRSHYCRIFNNPKNSRARLFLISTRAGGLGINLTAANRVIIFDASWNPSHDVQSIFRIYRFGQKKPCYVYRFLAQGTMEEKIYNRQVTKLSLSCRVVDEQQIERHYSNHDLAELYQFEPNTSKDKPTLNLPKDRLLAEIFRKYEDRIETFHEHDSLLENKAEEELDEEERKEAWKEYEDERTGKKMYMNNFPNQNFAIQPYDMMNMNQAEIANRATLSGINIETLQALIRKDYPNTTPEQQTMMTQRAIMDMYTYMEKEAIRQQQIAAAQASFTYPTVSNIGSGSFVNATGMTQAQRQYALQQQQQHQMLVQREQQANYAKRFGNVRGPALSSTATRPPQIVNVQLDDNDVIEVPTTPPPTAGPAPSSSAVQTSSTAAPAATGGNRKRQEE